jgi:Lon protease-like protein
VTRPLAIFPLGTVLLPSGLLPLHIFEPRYRQLMADLTADGAEGEVGIVLIERGHEVGGGDQRVGTGTLARLAHAEQLPDGRWLVLLAGVSRFRVAGWLPDDPYPQAEVDDLPEPDWDTADDTALAEAEAIVREAVALAAELGESGVPVDVALSEDPSERAWQLCAMAPIGPFDRQRLLELGPPARLAALAAEVQDVKRMLAFRLGGG